MVFSCLFFFLCKHKKLFTDFFFQESQKGLTGRHFIPFRLYLIFVIVLLFFLKETKAHIRRVFWLVFI